MIICPLVFWLRGAFAALLGVVMRAVVLAVLVCCAELCCGAGFAELCCAVRVVLLFGVHCFFCVLLTLSILCLCQLCVLVSVFVGNAVGR